MLLIILLIMNILHHIETIKKKINLTSKDVYFLDIKPEKITVFICQTSRAQISKASKTLQRQLTEEKLLTKRKFTV
jgi:hypothetical protein